MKDEGIITIIENTRMERRSIIPGSGCIFGPFSSYLILVRLCYSTMERIEKPIAETLFEAYNLLGEVLIHVQHLPACHWMCPHNRILSMISVRGLSQGASYSPRSRLG